MPSTLSGLHTLTTHPKRLGLSATFFLMERHCMTHTCWPQVPTPKHTGLRVSGVCFGGLPEDSTLSPSPTGTPVRHATGSKDHRPRARVQIRPGRFQSPLLTPTACQEPCKSVPTGKWRLRKGQEPRDTARRAHFCDFRDAGHLPSSHLHLLKSQFR